MSTKVYVEMDNLVWVLTQAKWKLLCEAAVSGQSFKMVDFGQLAPAETQKGPKHGVVDYYLDDWLIDDYCAELGRGAVNCTE